VFVELQPAGGRGGRPAAAAIPGSPPGGGSPARCGSPSTRYMICNRSPRRSAQPGRGRRCGTTQWSLSAAAWSAPGVGGSSVNHGGSGFGEVEGRRQHLEHDEAERGHHRERGRPPVSGGSTRPTAPRISTTPMIRTATSGPCPPSPSWAPVAPCTATFVPPAYRWKAARSAATIQSATSIGREAERGAQPTSLTEGQHQSCALAATPDGKTAPPAPHASLVRNDP
jgi:hypothetical protein